MSEASIKDLFENISRPSAKYDSYFDAYDTLFSKFRNKDITFVEIGILGGGSLEVWKNYFGPGSRIIGIDLNPQLKEDLKKDGFDVYIGDQGDPKFWEQFYKEVGKVDILLDDGGHTNEQQLTTLQCGLPHIKNGGMIVIEDVHASYMPKFGNPGKHSFIENAKRIIDIINSRSARLDEKLFRDDWSYSKYVYNVQFFESIAAFHIDTTLCRKSTLQQFGDKSVLPNQEIPEDLRHKQDLERRESISIWNSMFRKLSALIKK